MRKHPLALAMIALALASCDEVPGDTQSVGLDSRGRGPLRVMTRNLYVGADVDPILTAPPEEVPIVVAQAFATLQATDAAGRMAALAAEIAAEEPDLVGLQEVSTIRIQDPGDLVAGGQTPAEDVVVDFLPVLLAALEAEGVPYHVVAAVENSDAEAPMITPDFDFVDVRLTDADVLLARDGVDTTLVAEQSFAAALPLPNGLTVERGWLAVDATVRGRAYRVASTHLESGYPEVNAAQALELIAALEESPLPVVLLGDFNSSAPSGAAYQLLRAAGYDDAWLAAGNTAPGFTCCQAGDLRNEVSSLRSRIDLVLTRGLAGATVRARTTGDAPEDRTAAGLWPSDHAGVSVTIHPAR